LVVVAASPAKRSSDLGWFTDERRIVMLRKGIGLGLVVMAALLPACSNKTNTASSPSPASTTTSPSRAATLPTGIGTSSPAPAPSLTGTGASTSLDPCQLVTGSEASALAGTTFGTGTEQTNSDSSGTSKTCVYGSQTLNVFAVTVAQATSASAAQSDWSQEESRAQALLGKDVPSGISMNFNVNDVNVTGADRAAVGTISETIGGQALNAGAIYLLKGATFVTFSDLVLGHPAPGAAALEAQAKTTLGRV
jgi:hypothetical protein